MDGLHPRAMRALVDLRPVRALARARRTVRLPYARALELMLLPYVVGVTALILAPAVLSVALSFTAYDALSPPRWNGLLNFRLLLADPRLWAALGNSLMFPLLAVPTRVLGALALALLLNRPRRAVGLYRAAVFLPTVVPDVAYALVWLWILNPVFGPLNLLLGMLGLPTPAWLANPATAKPALALMSLFQIGEGFVLLLAGRRTIPAEMLEAAVVDGGRRSQIFRYVILPLMMPWLALLTFRDVIMSLQHTFTPAYIMTGGDPYYATLFLPLLAYDEAFEGLRFGQGAAVSLLMLALTAVLVFGLYALFRRWGYFGHDE